MPRPTETQTVGPVTFTVRAQTRKDKALAQILYNRLVGSFDEGYPALVNDLTLYCNIVVSASVQGLVTLDGQSYKLPEAGALTPAHLDAFDLFLETASALTDPIQAAFETLAASVVSRYALPESELTPEEKADPSS